jgi:hypothetical protein
MFFKRQEQRGFKETNQTTKWKKFVFFFNNPILDYNLMLKFPDFKLIKLD